MCKLSTNELLGYGKRTVLGEHSSSHGLPLPITIRISTDLYTIVILH